MSLSTTMTNLMSRACENPACVTDRDLDHAAHDRTGDAISDTTPALAVVYQFRPILARISP
jgi:hypothetical protein